MSGKMAYPSNLFDGREHKQLTVHLSSTPFVGEGVNCALYDSLQLGQQIVKHGLDDIESAVAEYEKLMFPRAIDLITRSRRSGEMLFAQDSPYGWLRAHVKSPNA